MLKFERLDTHTTGWDGKLKIYAERTIFQTEAWISFVAKTQKAEPVVAALRDDQTTVGYFTGLIIRRCGLRILGSPFPGWTTSYMGLCLSPDVPRRRVVEALIRFAFEELGCVHLEIMDRNLTLDELSGLRFEYRLLSSFEIDLTQDEKELFANMSGACRRCIRKAEKSGVLVEEVHDSEFAEEYYAQLKDVFAKQGLVPTYGIERVRELIKHIHPTGMLLLLRARDPNGHCIGTGIFPAMNQTMYFWGGASWRKDQILRPNEAIQWYAMKYWKERGICRYDMGGGGEYKRKYGGYEIAVPWFRKSKSFYISQMRNFAQELVKSRQMLLGKWTRYAGSSAGFSQPQRLSRYEKHTAADAEREG